MPTLRPLEPQHAAAVAALHAQSLPHDFLPSLGERFLQVLHGSMLELGLAWGWGAFEGPRLIGFVSGTDDSEGLFGQVLRRRAPRLVFEVARTLLRRPALLPRTLETLLYPSKEGGGPVRAEMLVLAVAPDQRGSGLGRMLIERFEQTLQARNFQAYKLTVLAKNTAAQRLYERVGFRRERDFVLYGKAWHLYVKRLSHAERDSRSDDA